MMGPNMAIYLNNVIYLEQIAAVTRYLTKILADLEKVKDKLYLFKLKENRYDYRFLEDVRKEINFNEDADKVTFRDTGDIPKQGNGLEQVEAKQYVGE